MHKTLLEEGYIQLKPIIHCYTEFKSRLVESGPLIICRIDGEFKSRLVQVGSLTIRCMEIESASIGCSGPWTTAVINTIYSDKVPEIVSLREGKLGTWLPKAFKLDRLEGLCSREILGLGEILDVVGAKIYSPLLEDIVCLKISELRDNVVEVLILHQVDLVVLCKETPTKELESMLEIISQESIEANDIVIESIAKLNL